MDTKRPLKPAADWYLSFYVCADHFSNYIVTVSTPKKNWLRCKLINSQVYF